MVLHMAAVGTLKLVVISSSHSSLSGAVISGLIWPFVLKLCFSYRLLQRRAYTDLFHASRLFFFQLEQIAAFDAPADQPEPAAVVIGYNNNSNSNSNSMMSRLGRLLRLLQRTVMNTTHVRRRRYYSSSQALELDEQSFHTLSMLAL